MAPLSHSMAGITPLLPIRVFLSSPGDLFSRRQTIKALITSLNHDPRYEDRYKFIDYAYEDRVPSVLGIEPQRAVDKYNLRPEAADIFICLFWRRLGSPTEGLIDPATDQMYPSGTVYELLSAYECQREKGLPIILLYRCQAPVEDPVLQTPEQQQALDTFLARCEQGGDLTGLATGSFTSEDDLLAHLSSDLVRVVEVDLRERLEAELKQMLRPRRLALLLPPPPPATYEERTELLNELRHLVLGSWRASGIVALHGQGGIGKTALAQALSYDPAVRGAFPDGVLWAELGPSSDVLEEQRRWIRALGGDPATANSVRDATDALRQLLQDRAVLLVLDNVWHRDVSNAFQVGGPHCHTLITTRDVEAVSGAWLLEIDVMQRDESVRFLRRKGGLISDALADEIAARLGDLPLALDLVAEQLRLGMSWPIIKSRLEREHDLHYLGLSQGRVYAVIASSVAALPEEIVTRFHELAIFPPGESLDPKAVTHLWAATAGLDEAQSEQLLLALRSRALLKIDNIVHDLVRDYLQLQFVSTPGRLSELHVRLAQSYGSYLQWPLTSAEGMYPWRRVLWHLVLGDEIAHAQRMITDEHYLTSKISLFGSEAAAREADLSAKGNDQVQLLAAALRRSEHILDHDISQLQNQLFGRMGDRSPLHNASPHEISLQLVRPSLAQARDSELRVLDKHHARVNGCAFSPDGTLLASAGDDCAVRLWDVATGAERRVLQVKGDKRYGAAYACVYNPNGNLLAVASTRGIQIWHVSTGEFVSALTESDTSEWFHCAFSPDGTLVVGTGADGKLMLWDLQTNTLVKSFEGHQKNVWHCTFDTSGQMLASAGWDGTLRLWSVTTGEERQLMRNPDILGWLYCCAFSPDGESLVATGKNGKIQVWDIGTGHLRHQIVGHVSGVHDAVTECAFSPNGQVLATSSEDGTVRLWASSVVVRATGSRGHDGGITAGTFSPDGRLFATAGEDKTIRFWNVSSGIEDNSMRLHSRIGNLSSIAFSADGQLLAMVNTWDGLHLWNMTQQTDQSGRIRGYEGSDPGMCVFSPNGRLVAVANQGDVSLLEVAERPDVELRALVKRLHSTGLDWMPNLAAHPTFCAFSPDGRFLVGSGHQGGLCIWDVATRNLLEVADKRFFTVCGSFSPNGKLMVTSESRTLRLWSVANYEETARGFLGFKHRVMHMRISPRQELSTPYWIYSCSFSPDGRFVATSGSDSAVRVWDADSLTELVHITLEGEVRACAWHPKDLLIGAGDMSGRIHFMALNESTRIEAQG